MIEGKFYAMEMIEGKLVEISRISSNDLTEVSAVARILSRGTDDHPPKFIFIIDDDRGPEEIWFNDQKFSKK